MGFEVREVYDKNDMKALNVAAIRTRPLGTVEKAGRGLRRFFGGLMLFASLYIVLSIPRLFPDLPGESKRMIIFSTVLMLIFGVSAFFPGRLGILISKLISQLAWKNYKEKGTEITWRFGEKEFTVHTLVSDLCCQYSVIDRVVESPTHVFLFLDARTAYMIRKDSFLLGDADVFGFWVAQKCGKELINIK